MHNREASLKKDSIRPAGPGVLLQPADPRWLEFVSKAPGAMIFHHPAWIQLLADCYRYRSFILAVPDSLGKIIAGVPFIEINRVLSGRRLVALSFTDHCVPLYGENSWQSLKESILALYAERGVNELEIRWDVPKLPSTQIVASHVLHTLDLEPDSGQVFRRFQPAHRRNIKTAQNSGLRVERGTDENCLRQFYRLHLETRHRQGVPIQPWRFFQLLGKELLEPGFGFVLSAYKDGECIASSIFLHWQKTLVYKYGASKDSMLAYRPNNLLMWEAIQWGCENGYNQFDFGRTDIKNEGLRRFKSGFGAQENLLTYAILSNQVKAASPNAANSRLMEFMHFVIHSTPLWVCRLAGEILYRYAG